MNKTCSSQTATFHSIIHKSWKIPEIKWEKKYTAQHTQSIKTRINIVLRPNASSSVSKLKSRFRNCRLFWDENSNSILHHIFNSNGAEIYLFEVMLKYEQCLEHTNLLFHFELSLSTFYECCDENAYLHWRWFSIVRWLKYFNENSG